jgi:hypothetical protein
MAKLYAKNVSTAPIMLPKKETIKFLLSYSKALRIVRTGNLQLEYIIN